MCGDGANDCGALRAAHAGISLSELESSVAAPFTSTQPDVSCVTRVLREGRAALTTSFGVFKFMIAYSLTEFFSVAFLYFFDANLTDFQFLYIDVALIVNFAFFFGMTEAYTGKLCGIPPLTSLLGLVPLLSLIGQMVLVAIAQYVCYYFLTTFPWYITQAVVFSHGSPYRRSVVTNRHLMISFVVMTALCVYITVIPPEWLSRFLELRMPKDSLLSYVIILVAMIQFIIALLFERVVIEYLMEGKQMIPKFLKEKRVRKTPHLMIRRQLTDMDYLEYSNGVSFDKETVTVSDCSSGKSR
jgi:magnesium-transporting ATPase (P-type)